RENGTEFVPEATVWERADPARVLAQEPDNPARAFRLTVRAPGGIDVGSRQGPFGSLSRAATPPLADASGSRRERRNAPPAELPESATGPASVGSSGGSAPATGGGTATHRPSGSPRTSEPPAAAVASREATVPAPSPATRPDDATAAA